MVKWLEERKEKKHSFRLPPPLKKKPCGEKAQRSENSPDNPHLEHQINSITF